MSEPVRILCVFGKLDCGGAETMCMNLYRKINKDRVQFDFVKHSAEKGAYEDEIKELGGRIFEAPEFKPSNIFSYENWWKNHLEAHPEHKVIHGHFFTISKVYFKVAKKMDRVTVGHCHSANFQHGLKASLRRLAYKSTENYCDFCLACSEQSGKFFFPHRKVTVIKNGIDAEKFSFNAESRNKVRKEFGIEQSFVVGVVGSINEVKNPFETIKIFKAVLKKEPGARLLWVGTGPLEEKVKEKARENGISDNVIFTGTRLDVNLLLQAMDCYIMPSLMEGLPVALIEAQAASIKCFCSNVITTEADVTGLCSFLPLGNRELWAEEILNSKSHERKNESEKIVASGFDVSANAAWFEKFYLEECLKK